MLGAGTQKSMEIDFVSLVGCRTFKYSIFGGVKVQFDLPVVIDKCINKVETCTEIPFIFSIAFLQKFRILSYSKGQNLTKIIQFFAMEISWSFLSILQEIQKLDQLLTHEVQLNNINRAFDLLKEPENVKVLIQL